MKSLPELEVDIHTAERAMYLALQRRYPTGSTQRALLQSNHKKPSTVIVLGHDGLGHGRLEVAIDYAEGHRTTISWTQVVE